jgi:membrane protease YdiL (CAAX protease family)
MEDAATHGNNAGSPSRRFCIFLAAFYAAWTLRVVLLLWVDPRIENFWLQQCWSQGLRVALWILPVLLYVRTVDHVGALRYLRLDTLPRGRRLWLGMAIFATFLALAALGAMLEGGRPANFLHTPPHRWAQLFVQMAFVALAEEILFRGFILTKLSSLQRRASKVWPTLISSALFVLIHVPGWLYMQGPQPALIQLAVSVFIISCVLGLLFQVTESLWPPVALHLLNNVLSGIMRP